MLSLLLFYHYATYPCNVLLSYYLGNMTVRPFMSTTRNLTLQQFSRILCVNAHDKTKLAGSPNCKGYLDLRYGLTVLYYAAASNYFFSLKAAIALTCLLRYRRKEKILYINCASAVILLRWVGCASIVVK